MSPARRGGVTEQAADAAIDQACRLLRLPTIRDRFAEFADAAKREQLTYRGFLVELLLAECDDRDRRRAARRVHDAGFPRSKTISRYGRVDLLCIDELNYMELDRRGAELLFQVLTEREERNSVAIASNESFSKAHRFPPTCARWRRTFTGSTRRAAAPAKDGRGGWRPARSPARPDPQRATRAA